MPNDAKPYLICSTPRSGSSLLGRLLQQTGVMGDPREYWNASVHLPRYAKDYGCIDDQGRVDIESYMIRLRRERSSPNGGFGLKAHFNQVATLINVAAIKDFMKNAVWIWIQRDDIVAQAVSFRMAQTTGAWSSTTAPHSEEPDFDAKDIEGYLNKILIMEATWRTFFAVNKRNPVYVRYDEILSEPERVVDGICAACDVQNTNPIFLETVDIKKQRTAKNEEWASMFRASSMHNLSRV